MPYTYTHKYKCNIYVNIIYAPYKYYIHTYTIMFHHQHFAWPTTLRRTMTCWIWHPIPLFDLPLQILSPFSKAQQDLPFP